MLVGVVTPHKTLHADVVVLAAALGIPELTKPLGLSVPLTAKPRTVTVITKPLKPILKHIIVNGTHPALLLRTSTDTYAIVPNMLCKVDNLSGRSHCSGFEPHCCGERHLHRVTVVSCRPVWHHISS